MKESHSTEKLYVATENIQNSLNNEIIRYLSNNNIDYVNPGSSVVLGYLSPLKILKSSL